MSTTLFVGTNPVYLCSLGLFRATREPVFHLFSYVTTSVLRTPDYTTNFHEKANTFCITWRLFIYTSSTKRSGADSAIINNARQRNNDSGSC